MEWNDIDSRLEALGKDRRWLSSVTPYSLASVRDAMGPNSKKRSDRMLTVLSRAIEDEEARRQPEMREVTPGVFEILTPELLHKADLASRIVGAPSISHFCRDVIEVAATKILADEAAGRQSTLYTDPPNPVISLKVADADDGEAAES
jgi:hypothetical protein